MHAQGKKVAILATNGFEHVELTEPRDTLAAAGAEVHIVSTESGSIKGWADGNWSDPVEVDRTVDQIHVDDYDALVLPGGVINPDKLRRDESAVVFVRRFVESGKPVAAICHAPWILAEADVLRGRRATSFFSIRTDVENAGASWTDQEVVVDRNLITSRSPNDLTAFNKAIMEALVEVSMA